MLGEDRLVFRDESGAIEDFEGFIAEFENAGGAVATAFGGGINFYFADSTLELPETIDPSNPEHMAYFADGQFTVEDALNLVGVAFDTPDLG